MLFGELEGVEVVGCGEDPGTGGRGSRGVGEEPERTAGRDARRSVRHSDEDGLVGEGEGKVGEYSFEGFVREGREADEKAARARGGSFGGGVGVGLGGDHRVGVTFSVGVKLNVQVNTCGGEWAMDECIGAEKRTLPQGLKPHYKQRTSGSAEAVPLSKTDFFSTL
jgi:hypothetical protein